MPHCFLPEPAFKRPDGSMIRAAELRKFGDELIGPGGAIVRVLQVQKHQAVERDIVCLQTSQSTFRITSDHPLLVAGCDLKPVPQEARVLVSSFFRALLCTSTTATILTRSCGQT